VGEDSERLPNACGPIPRVNHPAQPGNQKAGKQADVDALKKKDQDPLGLKLAETKDPLGEAMKFVNPLLEFSPKNVDVQIVGFEVYMRRKKYLLALRCLNAARALDPGHPMVHQQSIELRHALKSDLDTLPPKVREAVRSDFTAVPPSADLKKLNAEFKSKHRGSAKHLLAAVRVDKLLGADQGLCEKETLGVMDIKDLTLEDASVVLETLRAWASPEVEAFKLRARGKWPEALIFAA